MSVPLRILITADPELPVPPRFYGGIERVIALLADGLVARGHEVTLVAHPESRISGRLAPYGTRHNRGWSLVSNTATIMRSVVAARPDIVHSFGRLAALAAVLPWRIPKLMSYQRAVTRSSVAWGRRLSRGSLTFVGCSRRMLEDLQPGSDLRVVHNAVDVDRYAFTPAVASDAPLVFLGRIEEIKGPHIAIEVAKRTERRLILAGNVPTDHQRFFEQAIRPHLDGIRVRYIGPVDDTAKSALLSQASALLMPVLWEEPFGIVMTEALACGTPVIGLARGAVPEVIDDGVTGVVCRDESEMVAAVGAIGDLSRVACRRAAESRFSQRALTDGYEALYIEAIGGEVAKPAMTREAALAPRRD